MAVSCAVNARFLYQPVSGMERYGREIAYRLPGRARMLAPCIRLGGLRALLWEQILLPRKLARGELLWSPAQSGPLLVKRQLVSVHDLSVLDHPDWLSPLAGAWRRLILLRLLRQSCAILTGSEYLRERLVTEFGLPAPKLAVVPGGVDLASFHPASTEEVVRIRQFFRLPSDYLLFVGTLDPSKNLPLLLSAWADIAPRYPKMRLVIAGGMSAQARWQMPALPPGVVLLNRVEERDLPALYSGALAFVFPALHQGLALQVLEAMACGVPVIAARSGALPEVVGDDGILVDPHSHSALQSAIEGLITDAAQQADYCCRGLERARQYPWGEAARRVQEALDGCA